MCFAGSAERMAREPGFCRCRAGQATEEAGGLTWVAKGLGMFGTKLMEGICIETCGKVWERLGRGETLRSFCKTPGTVAARFGALFTKIADKVVGQTAVMRREGQNVLYALDVQGFTPLKSLQEL